MTTSFDRLAAVKGLATWLSEEAPPQVDSSKVARELYNLTGGSEEYVNATLLEQKRGTYNP